MTERRSVARLSGISLPVPHATLRPATPVHIVNLSETGALIQTGRGLRPGARVFLRIDAVRRTIGLAALVLRCGVWAIHPLGGVSYRAAIRFESACPTFWEDLLLDGETGRSRSPSRGG